MKEKMQWILFWVFTGFFVLISLATLIALFITDANLREAEREMLFSTFIVEVGVAVVALFWSIFGLHSKKAGTMRARLSLGEFGDLMTLIGKTARLEPRRQNGEALPTIESTVLDDNGPYLPVSLNSDAFSAFVTVESNGETYAGSFILGTHLVELSRS